jgi:hypothetical protein
MRLFSGYIDRRPLMERDGSGASTLLGLGGFVVRAQLLEEASGEWWYFDERAELRQLDTLRPVVDRLLVRPAGRCEADPRRVDLGLRDVDRERPDRCGVRRLRRRRNGHGGLLVVACRGPEELEHGGVLERGEFVTSMTTAAPSRTSSSPSPPNVSTPVPGHRVVAFRTEELNASDAVALIPLNETAHLGA